MPDNLSGSQSPARGNQDAVIALGNAGYPEEKIAQLIQSAEEPDDAVLLLKTLNDLADSGAGWKELASRIDESCYSLTDWAKAIVFFLKREGVRDSGIDPLSMLGYLSCSADAAANSPILLPFEEQVKEMLETFGYEGED